MGTLPATRSQQGCWEIGAGAGSQMGTAGSQNSSGSQQGCWEPATGTKNVTYFYVKANVFLQKVLIWPAAGAKNFSVC